MKNVTTVLGEVKDLSEYRYFVTMTDTMLSGWGQAENKTAKRVILCQSWREAQIIVSGLNNCKNRNGMRYINIAYKFPKYSEKRYTVSVDEFEDCTLYIRKSDIK